MGGHGHGCGDGGGGEGAGGCGVMAARPAGCPGSRTGGVGAWWSVAAGLLGHGGLRGVLEAVQPEWWHLVRENVNLGLSQKSSNEVRAACRDSV